MFDALMAAVAADRDRACLVASCLQEEKAWSRPQKVRVDPDGDEAVSPISFDCHNTLSVTDMAMRVQSLPKVDEKPGEEIDTESGDIL